MALIDPDVSESQPTEVRQPIEIQTQWEYVAAPLGVRSHYEVFDRTRCNAAAYNCSNVPTWRLAIPDNSPLWRCDQHRDFTLPPYLKAGAR